MNLPAEAPKLTPLPFIIADIVLILTALLIAYESPSPLSTFPLIAITVCVCVGAVLACLPVILNYTRRRDTLLDERQDQLVAITQTAAAAANQLSIAASNLHDIAESTTRMLKHADTLPSRLQEKIGEFKTQLNEVAIAENEALEQEINTLRASETERLETALASIKKLADEILDRENTAKKQSDDVARKLTQFPAEIDTAAKSLATQLSVQITTALAAARSDLAQTLGESLERRDKESLSRLTSEIASMETNIKTRLEQWLAEHSAPTPAAPTAPVAPDTAPVQPPSHIQAHPKNTPKPDDTIDTNTADEFPAANSEPPFKKTPKHPPASPRIHEKTKPEKPANSLPPEDAPEPADPNSSTSTPTPPEEKHPDRTDPKSEPPAPPPPPEPPSPPEPPPPAEQPKAEEAPPPPSPPPRKRTPKPKPPRDEEPTLDLDLPSPSDEYSQSEPDDGDFSSAMSADGVTRLIVTAYIGIGNKLFIRGDGPGLSWDKGVPLQFVSIGKWRWETHDATAPVSFKLYKNDTVECTRIGSPKLEPGHQHEVTANF